PRDAGRIRALHTRVGARGAARAARSIRCVAARHVVSDGGGRLGALVRTGRGRRHTHVARRAVPPRASSSLAGACRPDPGCAGARRAARARRVASRDRDRRHDQSGRWTALGSEPPPVPREAAVEAYASALLARYGIVFRRLLARETNPPTWRELTMVYRRR